MKVSGGGGVAPAEGELFTGLESVQAPFQKLLDALHVSENRFREALESLHIPAALLNPHGAVTFSNSGLFAATGTLPQQVLGRDWFHLWERRPGAEQQRKAWREAVERGTAPPPQETVHPDGEGGTRCILWSATLMRNEHAEVVGVTCLGEDVTRRRRVEETLQRTEASFHALMDALPDAVLVEQQRHCVYANPRALMLMGAPDVAHLQGRSLLELIDPLDRAAIQQQARAVLAGLHPVRGREVRVRSLQGAETLVEITLLRVDVGGAPALLALAHDVTERKAVEAQRVASERLASAAQLGQQLDAPLALLSGVMDRLSDVVERLKHTALALEGAELGAVQRLVGGLGEVTSLVAQARQGHGAIRAVAGALASDEPPLHDPALTPPGGAARPPPRSGRILVVDDEMDVLVSISRMLCQVHEVVAVTSTDEALACVSAGAQFDVILCDLLLAEGPELHAELMRRAPEQARRVVFMTPTALTPSARSYLLGVANLCIRKPLDERSLHRLVNSCLAAAS
ncbi:MAG: PAS domain-containing protein [Myxococcota bacterium]